MTQKMARGFSLFEEALLVFNSMDPNVEGDMKFVAAIQDEIKCYHIIYDKKRITTQTPPNCFFFFFKKEQRIESSKEPELVPWMSGVREAAICPPSPIADDPSALPSPTSSPHSSQ